jgi:thiol-disulfide isomerase/thioredoxin
MRKLIGFILFLCFSMPAFAQENNQYKIEIKIKNSNDTLMYLANYYGDKTYLADTTFVKGKGNFVFENKKELKDGLYIVVNQDKKSLFEFLVADSRQMKFETEAPDFTANMKSSNSLENDLFFSYLDFSSKLYDRVMPLNARLKALDKNSDSVAIIQSEIKSINQEMTDYKEELMKNHPETFLADFFGLLKEAAIPDTLLTLPDGSKDSSYPYRYYKAHFWDHVDLSNDGLIRTPVFHKKLDTYFDKVISKDADSIIYEIDHLLSQMDESGDMYKFSLWHLTIKFDESQIMGHDGILVHLSDHYFSKGKAHWLHEEVIQNIIKEADKRRSTLIGNLAPNLIMQDTSLKPRSLHELNQTYTILYFWDPGCGHCKKETPKLVEFYNQYAEELDFEIYSVCADTNLSEMKKYIKEKKMNFINVNGPRAYTSDYHELYNIFSTPVIIILDQNKKIIAKRLAAEQMADFLKNYTKQHEPRITDPK